MLPARLPIPVPPARHELVTSYVSRLAALHGMGFAELWAQISDPSTPAAAAGTSCPTRSPRSPAGPAPSSPGPCPSCATPPPTGRLFRHEPQPGCPRCDARHPGGPVTRLLPHHRYVCPRHRHWIGPPDICRGRPPR